jgi:hypothetical protein
VGKTKEVLYEWIKYSLICGGIFLLFYSLGLFFHRAGLHPQSGKFGYSFYYYGRQIWLGVLIYLMSPLMYLIDYRPVPEFVASQEYGWRLFSIDSVPFDQVLLFFSQYQMLPCWVIASLIWGIVIVGINYNSNILYRRSKNINGII